jgi:hypothetical protein
MYSLSVDRVDPQEPSTGGRTESMLQQVHCRVPFRCGLVHLEALGFQKPGNVFMSPVPREMR